MEVLGLEDLVRSKKTQRDKDWPMLRRLVEVNYDSNFASPTAPRVEFWLRELRTPEILAECAGSFTDEARRLAPERPLLLEAISGDLEAIRASLRAEEVHERDSDRKYWAPLRSELEAMRRGRSR